MVFSKIIVPVPSQCIFIIPRSIISPGDDGWVNDGDTCIFVFPGDNIRIGLMLVV